jgi:hypothetical protein
VPISTLNVTGIAAQGGTWSNLTAAALQSQDASRAQGAVGATATANIGPAPADYGSLNSLTVRVNWRITANASRAKSILVEAIIGGAVVGSFTTPTQATGAQDRTDEDTLTFAAASLDGLQLRMTLQEAGGMADSVQVAIDRLWADANYEPAATGPDPLHLSFAAAAPATTLEATTSHVEPESTERAARVYSAALIVPAPEDESRARIHWAEAEAAAEATAPGGPLRILLRRASTDTTRNLAIQAVLEGAGHTVTRWTSSTPPANLLADFDLVYIETGTTAFYDAIGDLPIPFVFISHADAILSGFGTTTTASASISPYRLTTARAAHPFIGGRWGPGDIPVHDPNQQQRFHLEGNLAPGVEPIFHVGSSTGNIVLAVAETGAELFTTAATPARRVWDSMNSYGSSLGGAMTTDGVAILLRTVEWAANVQAPPAGGIEFAATAPATTLAAEVTTGVPVYAAGFAATAPATVLDATTRQHVPGAGVAFYATAPATALAAGISRTRPEHAVGFAATAPATTLAAALRLQIAGSGVAFHAAAPATSLTVEVSRTRPAYSTSFGGVAPATELNSALGSSRPVHSADFSALAPPTTLEAGVSRARPAHPVSFAVTSPASTLTAGLRLSVPGAGLGFYAIAPATQLVAGVTRSIPERSVAFAATAPATTLDATLRTFVQGSGVAFHATAPATNLSAEVERTRPEHRAAFSAVAPATSLAVQAASSAPSFAVAFTATAPATTLSVGTSALPPGMGVRFDATAPATQLGASLSRTRPEHVVGFGGQAPATSLSSTLSSAAPASSLAFAATAPATTLSAALESAPPGSGLAFSAAAPVTLLTVGLSRSAPTHVVEFSAVAPATELAALVRWREAVALVFVAEAPATLLRARVGAELPDVVELPSGPRERHEDLWAIGRGAADVGAGTVEATTGIRSGTRSKEL